MQGYEKHKPALHFFKNTWKNIIETLSHKSEPIITTIKWKLPINVSTQACSYRNPAIVAKVLSGSWLPARSHGTLIGGLHFMMLWTQPVLWMEAVLFQNVLCRKPFRLPQKHIFWGCVSLQILKKKLVRHWLACKENTKISRSILVILFSNNQRLWNGFAETVSINYSKSYVHQQIIYQIIYFNKNI